MALPTCISQEYKSHIPSGQRVALFAHMGKYLRRETREGVFCSQLMAKTLMEAGVLQKNRVSNWYTPADFGSENTLPFIEKGLYKKEQFFRFSNTKVIVECS
ncbi:hypothetical protein [Chitinivibrio alkaliphilus]|uniref:Uncharacterized protein n=1 Tax=Chitinivibrio alkaliphilus ACht1 TaxID=1313304 RepID=U7D643_9BACT|nr:hypothetical protein [Chitinivibrio alkaliphilus]ERP31984.1 hypothetical protein CALK_0961 [Chitinivibrio alkaliphilus ACht1]